MRKLDAKGVQELVEMGSMDHGFRPDLKFVKGLLGAFNCEATDDAIEEALPRIHKNQEKFEELFNMMFTKEGDIDWNGMGEVVKKLGEENE